MPLTSATNFVLFALLLAGSAHAQQAPAPAEKAAPAPEKKPTTPEEAHRYAIRSRDPNLDPLRTYHLQAGGSANYGNEILTGMRLMLDPSCKMYLVPMQKLLLLRCDPESLAMADKLMAELDVPKPNYRLTFTIVESEAGKRLGVQHFTLEAVSGERTTLKNGSKVPVATGSYSTAGATAQTQFTYLDVGLNFDFTLTAGAGGVGLVSKIEQSSTTEDRTITGIAEPIVRQTVLEGGAILVPGKPLPLGSLDLAGSPRHLDVEVLLEPAK